MSKLLNRVKLFAEMNENPEAVYKNAQRDHELIKEAIMHESDRWNPRSHFQPVVLLRYMLFQNIQEGVSIDSQGLMLSKTKSYQKISQSDIICPRATEN